MPGDKPDLSKASQVRIPDELNREMEMECVKEGLFKYQLIEKMWRTYKLARKGHASPTISDSPQLVKSDDAEGDSTPRPAKRGTAGQRVLHIGERAIEITSVEGEWVERALVVLRSQKKNLPVALQSNLIEFTEAAERYERERHPHEPEIGAGKPVRAKGINDAIAEADRLAGEVHEALRRRKGRKAGDAGKDRKRG